MRHLAILLCLLTIGCQAAEAAQSTERRQPILMLDSHGWAYERGSARQDGYGDICLALPRLEHGRKLAHIAVFYAGGAGHEEPLGQTIGSPALWVFQQDATGAEQVLASEPDDLGVTAAEYEAPHRIIAGIGGHHEVDLASYDYFACLTSEAGEGFRPGARVTALSVAQ
jgi:hypothetical protein